MVDVFELAERARLAGDEVQLERALKWYLCVHDVLLRGPRRGTRGGGRDAFTSALEWRFRMWREGQLPLS